MEDRQKPRKERVDNEILFSKTVKAGKRVYYIDVKRDRKGEFYISMTESKRLKEQGDALHPAFEKHKIFLYREDLEKFQTAFNEAADYTHSHAPSQFACEWSVPADEYDNADDGNEEVSLDIQFE